MDLVRKEQLRALIADAGGPCASIYIPTHRGGVDVKQDPIRLKNQMKRVEKEVVAQGLRTLPLAEYLEPLQRLCDNAGFWRYQSDGLALFRSPRSFYYYRLPLAFDELVVVSDRFHVKPLMRLFTENGRFYLLTLSKNEIRLFQCTRFGVREVELPVETPGSLNEALQAAGVEKQVQFHAAGTSRFHGHGGRAEDEKEDLRGFFRLVDKGVRETLRDDPAPLVLAGVEYLFPLYRDVNTHPNLLEGGVTGNPEGRRPEELQTAAWAVVEPHLARARREAARRYQESAGSARVSNDLHTVLPAAFQGRIENLFVAAGRQQWGSYEAATEEIRISEQRRPGDRDLLNLAAVQSFLQGATVYAVDPGAVPGGGDLAAVFRY